MKQQGVFAHKTGNWLVEIEGNILVRLSLTKEKTVALFSGEIKNHINAVQNYFEGKIKTYPLPIKLNGTPFQMLVWQELQKIPYGQTISYKKLAEKIGARGAFRAVGSACGKNPVAVVVPCHRVLASSGALGGYAYGLDIKQKLLEHESEKITSQHQLPRRSAC